MKSPGARREWGWAGVPHSQPHLQASRASPLQLSATFPEMRACLFAIALVFSILLFPGMILAGGDRVQRRGGAHGHSGGGGEGTDREPDKPLLFFL